MGRIKRHYRTASMWERPPLFCWRASHGIWHAFLVRTTRLKQVQAAGVSLFGCYRRKSIGAKDGQMLA